MNNKAPNDFSSMVLSIVVAMAIAALLFVHLHSLGKTTIRDDHDLPPVASPKR
jgi:capsular polysaccharide biosynthesis protein